MTRSPLLTVAALIGLWPAAVSASDWPQLLGPNRDGVAVGEEPLTRLPTEAAALWTARVGDGFAGPAVVDGIVYLAHRPGETLRIEARDAETGRRLWTADTPATYGRPGFISDRGPRATPVVVPAEVLKEPHGRVLALGAGGLLRCVSAVEGKEHWTKDVARDYGGDLGYFGLGSTPLVVPDGDGGAVVIVVPGGFRENAGIVGLDLKTGAERWTTARAKPCYGSPILTEIAGEPVVVVPTRVTLYGLNPLTGEVRWEVPFGAQGPTAIGANPVVLPSRSTDETRPIFLSSNYSTGDVLLNAGLQDADVRYNGDFLLASHYATPIGFGSPYLYGLNGQENRGPASFVCINPVSKRTLWKKSGVGYGSLIGVPGEEPGTGSVLKLGLDGELILFDADPAKYRELGRLRLFPPAARGGETRAAPAYSNGV
ncbi:MAG: PQQ-binding-like beta-propeller repeat protein, partial [Planctomycetota bacterium]